MANVDIQELLIQPTPLGENFLAGRSLIGPKSYTTGGVLVSAQVFGLLSTVRFWMPETLSKSGPYFVKVLRTGTGVTASVALFQWFVQSTGAQVANATDLSAETIRVIAIGN